MADEQKLNPLELAALKELYVASAKAASQITAAIDADLKNITPNDLLEKKEALSMDRDAVAANAAMLTESYAAMLKANGIAKPEALDDREIPADHMKTAIDIDKNVLAGRALAAVRLAILLDPDSSKEKKAMLEMESLGEFRKVAPPLATPKNADPSRPARNPAYNTI